MSFMDNSTFQVGDRVVINEGEYAGKQATISDSQFVKGLGWQYALEGVDDYQGNRYTLFEGQIQSVRQARTQINNTQQQQQLPTGYKNVAQAMMDAANQIEKVDTNVVNVFNQILDELKGMRAVLDEHVATKELKIVLDSSVPVGHNVHDFRMEEVQTAALHNGQASLFGENKDSLPMKPIQEEEVDDSDE
tara:strand:+ start:45011 stop:45583 length:573 start_codon:yes stop_codon:yes gene_type:complete